MCPLNSMKILNNLKLFLLLRETSEKINGSLTIRCRLSFIVNTPTSSNSMVMITTWHLSTTHMNENHHHNSIFSSISRALNDDTIFQATKFSLSFSWYVSGCMLQGKVNLYHILEIEREKDIHYRAWRTRASRTLKNRYKACACLTDEWQWLWFASFLVVPCRSWGRPLSKTIIIFKRFLGHTAINYDSSHTHIHNKV